MIVLSHYSAILGGIWALSALCRISTQFEMRDIWSDAQTVLQLQKMYLSKKFIPSPLKHCSVGSQHISGAPTGCLLTYYEADSVWFIKEDFSDFLSTTICVCLKLFLLLINIAVPVPPHRSPSVWLTRKWSVKVLMPGAVWATMLCPGACTGPGLAFPSGTMAKKSCLAHPRRGVWASIWTNMQGFCPFTASPTTRLI